MKKLHIFDNIICNSVKKINIKKKYSIFVIFSLTRGEIRTTLHKIGIAVTRYRIKTVFVLSVRL